MTISGSEKTMTTIKKGWVSFRGSQGGNSQGKNNLEVKNKIQICSQI